VIVVGVLVAWALAIVVWDGRCRRIPNMLLLLVLIPATLAVLVNGQGLLGAGAGASFTGMALSALLLPGYALGQMGAGDVKFSACLGFLLGGWAALEALLLAALLLGALALGWRWLAPQQASLPAAGALAGGFMIHLVSGPVLIT
jgi:prepilin peptidase CpaA